MRRWLALIAAGAALCFSAGAWAQNTDVRDHYRAYRAALAAGDIETADQEGEAAWRASEQSAGPGAQTAVLAYNLATLRLDDERPRDAAEPARRALELADASDGQVSRENAMLIIALGGSDRTQRRQIIQAMRVAAAVPENDQGFLYIAGVLGGDALLVDGAYDEAAEIYGLAAGWSAHASGDHDLARVRALIGQGASRIYLGELPSALDSIDEALKIVAPLAPEPATFNPVLSPAETMYATAMAWRTLLFSADGRTNQMEREVRENRRAYPAGARIETRADLPPICRFSYEIGEYPNFPIDARGRSGVGAVVVRFAFDAQGNVVYARVASMAPSTQFSDAVDRVLNTWRAERAPDNDADCRMQTHRIFAPVRFGN